MLANHSCFSISGALLLVSLNATVLHTQEPAPITRNDYGHDNAWLCKPGRQDACGTNADATVITADGVMTRERFVVNPSAPIDCFYIYPTVSAQQTNNSDMQVTAAEQGAAFAQFARFGAVCRTFAPMYRQRTLAGLRRGMAGAGSDDARTRLLAFNDVLDAWNYYLAHENNGRGVALFGHSQGASILTELSRREIDGKPQQTKLVSAILLGTAIAVPKGKDVGATFNSIPLCRSMTQTGCVISYSSFRASAPPPANTFFGTVPGNMLVAACTNPASLAGGSGELKSYFTAGSAGFDLQPGSAAPPAWKWVKSGTEVPTVFVSEPGLVTATCASNENASGYLRVTVISSSNDKRVADIPGDILLNGIPQANWGLHVIDVSLSLGTLVDIVAKQGDEYVRTHH